VWRVEDGVDIVAFVKPAKFERDDDWDCAEAGERLGREDLLGGDEVWSLSIDSSSLIRVSSFSYRFLEPLVPQLCQALHQRCIRGPLECSHQLEHGREHGHEI